MTPYDNGGNAIAVVTLGVVSSNYELNKCMYQVSVDNFRVNAEMYDLSVQNANQTRIFQSELLALLKSIDQRLKKLEDSANSESH